MSLIVAVLTAIISFLTTSCTGAFLLQTRGTGSTQQSTITTSNSVDSTRITVPFNVK
ncbi:hypothetical protein [Peromfec virus RodF7_7]|uniref:Uncharacterized protein n=1 Tax=Peromfec virus RodF7_7 TaxID=2929355 RepID=A0A976N2G8_9VIRU|nr:hypothetical protein [Peromfec virus RodF7_7]